MQECGFARLPLGWHRLVGLLVMMFVQDLPAPRVSLQGRLP